MLYSRSCSVTHADLFPHSLKLFQQSQQQAAKSNTPLQLGVSAGLNLAGIIWEDVQKVLHHARTHKSGEMVDPGIGRDRGDAGIRASSHA